MRRTDNYGKVIKVLPGGLVEVKLEGGLGQLPLPADTLEPAPRADEAAPTPPPADPSNASVSEDNGVQIAFDPQIDNEANPVAYEVYLLNSTPHKIIYELKALTHGQRRWGKTGQLPPNSKKRLEVVEYRWLNEKLTVELDVRTVETGGTGPRHFQKISIKGKQFFGKLTDVPELYRDAHLYVVFPRLSSTTTAPASAPASTSLRALTQAQLANRPAPARRAAPTVKPTRTDLRARLEFDNSIDLHLAALVPDPAAVPRNQVLSTQLRYFENYLSMALKLGVDNIFVIHGVGDGILKREVHKMLDRTRFVRQYRNEYHEKYGYGATEVIFD